MVFSLSYTQSERDVRERCLYIACKQKQHHTYKAEKRCQQEEQSLKNATEPNSANPEG